MKRREYRSDGKMRKKRWAATGEKIKETENAENLERKQ
jgi:hypothetical protein